MLPGQAATCTFVSADLFKAHWGITERAGLLALQPLVDARQVEVVPACGPNLGVLCSQNTAWKGSSWVDFISQIAEKGKKLED